MPPTCYTFNYVLLILCILVWSHPAMSQITFEEGYYLDNNGTRVAGLILNSDWRNNPDEIQFKVSESAEPRFIGIHQAQEFGIGNQVKYQRHTVNMDKSSDLLSDLSHERAPRFTEATLFLKVLVEGAANLYQYEGRNNRRFFFNVSDEGKAVEPLIYRRYKVTNSATAANYHFRQQLINQMDCEGLSKTLLKRMEYKTDMLVKYFRNYNDCRGGGQALYVRKSKESGLSLSVRVGLVHANTTVQHEPSYILPESRRVSVEYGGKIYPRIGLELEMVLPFGGDKWSLFLDPSYQLLRSEKEFVQTIGTYEIETSSEINYKTVEVPIGIRHYMFLNDQSQLFLNASIAMVFNSDSWVTFETPTGLGYISDLDIVSTEAYFSLGLGYRFSGRLSLEARYNTKRELLGSSQYWTAPLVNNFSAILGYTFL